jgi:hypothetical protein
MDWSAFGVSEDATIDEKKNDVKRERQCLLVRSSVDGVGEPSMQVD